MLPYEPLIKTVHSKIKCYTRKTKKKIKSGDIHTYSSQQYIIILKHDQPFECDQEVSILKAEDFFKMNNLINQRREDFAEQLEKIISLEQENKTIKEKLKYYDDLEVDIKIRKLKRLEKEIVKLEKKVKTRDKELSDLRSRLESKDDLIHRLKGGGVLGKISSIFTSKDDKNP